MAVFNSGSVDFDSLVCPVVLLLSERNPTALLNPPVVRLNRALCPSAVLPPG
jgi:hypothetical protein